MRVGLALVVTCLYAPSVAADRAPAQPDTLYGPALSLGYDYAPRGAVGLNVRWAPENQPGGIVSDRFASELEFDIKILPRWIFSASVASALWVERMDENDAYIGNFTMSATRSFEPEFGARSFLGVLPSLTIGTVLPTRNRKPNAAVPDPLLDQYVLYKRDVAALLLGAHVRLDLFIRNGLLFQTGPEVQILAEGNVIVCWQTMFGFGFWKADRFRVIGEYDYLRESGRADAFIDPTSPSTRDTSSDGVRHTIHAGISWAITKSFLLDIRRSIRHFPDTRDGWTASAHYEW